MKITTALYVDNQDIIRYPLKSVLKRANVFDDCYIFVSSQAQKDLIAALGLIPADHLVTIDYGVKTPSDIAHAENKAINWLFTETDVDFIVWLHADVLMSAAAVERCKLFAVEENLALHLPLKVWQLRMFCWMYHTIYGAVVIGRECSNRFPDTMDGGYLTGHQNPDGLAICYDVGHFDRQTMINKDNNHSKVWNAPSFPFNLKRKEY